MTDDESNADVALRQAERVVDQQLQTLSDIDSKAVRLLRLDVILIGLTISLVSAVTRLGVSPRTFWNLYFLGGGLSLLTSTVTAAVTYTESHNRVGPSGRDVRRIVSGTYSTRRVKLGLARSYAGWIQSNHETNARSVPSLTVSVVTHVLAFVFASVGVVESLFGALSPLVGAVPVVSAVILIERTGLSLQLRRVLSDEAGRDNK